MWLLALLAAVPSQAARAHALISYVADDYAAAVSASGEMISAQELDEQRLFAAEAAEELRGAGAADLAADAERLGEVVRDRAAPREVVTLAHALAGRIAQRFQLSMLPR